MERGTQANVLQGCIKLLMLFTKRQITSSWCLFFPGCAGLDLPLTPDLPGLKHETYPSYKNRPSPRDLRSTAHSDPPQLRRTKTTAQLCLHLKLLIDQDKYTVNIL